MPELLSLIIVAFLTYAAWQDRAQLADDWTQLLRELGL